MNEKWKYEFQAIPMLSVFILTTLKCFYHLTFLIWGFDLLVEVVGFCVCQLVGTHVLMIVLCNHKKQGCPYISTTTQF